MTGGRRIVDQGVDFNFSAAATTGSFVEKYTAKKIEWISQPTS